MDSIEASLRETVGKLLSEKKVDRIIGYEHGTLPLRATPCFLDNVEDVQKLVWNPSCDANLAKYVVDSPKTVGVVAKGCDARAIAVCIVEKQIPRANVVILGIPCQGVIDRRKVDAQIKGQEVLEAAFQGDHFTVKGEGVEVTLATNDFLCNSCQTCQHRTPPVYDVLVGESTPETREIEEYAEIATLEAKSSEERWSHFTEELSRCIRCYACRNVCPLCYCKTCFVDQTMPAWFGKTTHLSDTVIYHLIRAFHVAGRCVDCGACTRVCPMGINLRELVKKTGKIMKERYNYEAGVNLDQVPPLGEFKADDLQEFIK